MLHASTAATMMTPRLNANSGSERCTLYTPQDSAKSPLWSATHDAPAAAIAINTRKRMIRYMEFLLCRFGERGHGFGGELTGGGERGIPGIALVEPGLGGGAIGRR